MSEVSRLPPARRIEARGRGLRAPVVPTVDFLVFALDAEDYAVPLAEVREILKVPQVTDVPRAASEVLGILSLRGTVVTLVDLRRRIGLPERPIDRRSRVLIVQRRGVDDDDRSEGEPLGLLVDSVAGVVRLHPEDIEDKPAVPATRHAEYLAGVACPAGALYVLLNLEAVLAGL